MNPSLLLPSQEIKRELQEHAEAKSTIDVQKDTQINPDWSYGVFNTAKVCARVRAVQEARDINKSSQAAKQIDIDTKAVVRARMKREAFENIKSIVSCKEKVEVIPMLMKKCSNELKLAYQHTGGVLATLPNG